MKNIFIEGIPGSGKTTLLRRLSGELPGYHAQQGYPIRIDNR